MKIKVAIRRGTGHVLMGEHVVPMELVFVKLDLMDQIVNLVYSIIQQCRDKVFFGRLRIFQVSKPN